MIVRPEDILKYKNPDPRCEFIFTVHPCGYCWGFAIAADRGEKYDCAGSGCEFWNPHHGESYEQNKVEIIDAKYKDTCDCCRAQEGNYYCLLHGILVKNMNVKRCKDWEQKR
jgi:hypothetical protein